MSNSDSPSGFDAKNYQLPQQDWVCGHLADGGPCSIGPSTKGSCLAENICQPQFDGNRWHCTRLNAWGGQCHEGPIPDADSPEEKAICPHRQATCQPARSLRSRRKMVTGLVFAASLGFCLLILGGSSETASTTFFETTAIISPGPLSSPHSAIQEGCQACHSSIHFSPVSMIGEVWDSHDNKHQSELCLNCHRDFGEHAMNAHNADPVQLTKFKTRDPEKAQLTSDQLWARALIGDRVSNAEKLSCATCHQEHQGADFDLTHLTNKQCQSCHENTFHSFSDGHPEFETLRVRIRFDHSSHFGQHYNNYPFLMPSGIPKQSCNECHLLSSDGASYQLAGFEAMCSSCHESQILDFQMPTALRLDQFEFLKSQPILETPSAKSLELPPFMELMLRADEEIADAIDSLQRSETSGDESQAQNVALIKEATRSLLIELKQQGAQGVAHRLSRITRGPKANRLVTSLTEALVQSRFFEMLSKNNKNMKAKNSENSMNDREVTIGSWTMLSDQSTVVYRPQQHADPLSKSWLDLMANQASSHYEETESPDHNRFDDFFRTAVSPEATGRCTKCHTVDRLLDGSLKINWGALPADQFRRQFSEFVHRPHLTLMQDRSTSILSQAVEEEVCLKCHQPEKAFLSRSAFILPDGMPVTDFHHANSTGYLPIQRRDCVQCHQLKMAGDNCLQCHNYHIHGSSVLRR